MKKISLLTLLLSLTLSLTARDYTPRDYVWTTQSRNASESMPCGGHDIGMNVWVEGGDILIYLSQSGWFDENNTLLKAGRIRLHFDGQPLNKSDFEQRLSLDQGAIYVRGGGMEVRIWADVFDPSVYIDMTSKTTRSATVSYESWRYRDRPVTKAECQQCSWKWIIPSDCMTYADSIQPQKDQLTFIHKNRPQTIFDFTVSYERLDNIKSQLYNPLGNREMRGVIRLPGFTFVGTQEGRYASTDYRAWRYQNKRLRHSTVSIALKNGEDDLAASPRYIGESRRRSAQWWHAFWQRSWIQTDSDDPTLQRILRNYELTRLMLGCNAYGQWPMKFNGGLFTFDPEFATPTKEDGTPENPFTPDYRKWGGGTMTAQNQRLLYWPLLKSGDYDLLRPQLDTYLRLLPTAVARTQHYWGHGGASFTEQLENFGLPNPAEYGKHAEGSDYGLERNAWLEYEWDTALEFCLMAIMAADYESDTLRYAKYNPLVEECLRFFDEHYQYQAKKLGAKVLDENGQLIIYPGSGCETYKMAYNPSSTIAALQTVAGLYPKSPLPIERIPDIPLLVNGADTCIAPAVAWARIQNTETPQLYPVFPWRIYGLGRSGIETARNTYLKDSHALAMRSSKGWKQDNIWAACLGLTEEAQRLCQEKFADGPYRFPAFWDPGFDWAPDLNRGGSAMIGLQEMLLQETPTGELLLFPAWPKEWNVSFRLRATSGRIVEAHIVNGTVKSTISPNNL
ncbi:MAG: hypothetical protein J5682_09155 [Prevotella sp.]|nr:hypothetical protein [Prevotella sp.]